MYCIETWVPTGLLLPGRQASVLVQGPEARGRLGSGGLPASLAASHIASRSIHSLILLPGRKERNECLLFLRFPSTENILFSKAGSY